MAFLAIVFYLVSFFLFLNTTFYLFEHKDKPHFYNNLLIMNGAIIFILLVVYLLFSYNVFLSFNTIIFLIISINTVGIITLNIINYEKYNINSIYSGSYYLFMIGLFFALNKLYMSKYIRKYRLYMLNNKYKKLEAVDVFAKNVYDKKFRSE